MPTAKSLRALVLAAALVVLAGCATRTIVSGFAPLYPVQTFSVQIATGRNPGDVLDYPNVDSVQPTLRWEPFPGTTQYMPGGEVEPFVDIKHGSVTDITYDLKIWSVSNGIPADVVYERDAIPAPSHHIESPLMPNTKYAWSVRARFKLDGKPRESEWSLSQIPCPPQFGLKCARGVARELGHAPAYIPPFNYYRFKTP